MGLQVRYLVNRPHGRDTIQLTYKFLLLTIVVQDMEPARRRESFLCKERWQVKWWATPSRNGVTPWTTSAGIYQKERAVSSILGWTRYVHLVYSPHSLSILTTFFTANWKGSISIPEQSFEIRERRLQGEVRTFFLHFLRTALTWLPEERPSAEDLARHAFLMQAILAANGPEKYSWITVCVYTRSSIGQFE